MRRFALSIVAAIAITAEVNAQVPDSIQVALDRAAPAALAKGGLYMARDSVFDVDTVVVRQYEPLPPYPRWWNEVQGCAGLAGSLDGWSWIAVPGDGFLVKGEGPVPGWAAVEDSNFLILVKYMWNEQLVKHEMLHALVWQNRKEIGHPTEFEDCGLQAQ